MSAETEIPATPPAPKYRYFTVPPATVRLTVDDLTALLPEGAWIGTDADKRRELALPTSEILQSNFPRIRFSRLRDLLPGCVQPVADTPEWIALPTDRIVLAYKPETRRELITDTETKPDSSSEAPADADPSIPSWKRLPKPALAPPPLPPAEADVPAALPPPLPPAPAALADLRLASEAEARLQQVFMTEDELTVARLIELCGALPGLQGCVLTHGSETVSSPGAPSGHDMPSLTTGTRELLDALGKSSGLHFQPAITLYAESGPISLLQEGGLRLLVVHRERGFLPGVREKLATTLELIARA